MLKLAIPGALVARSEVVASLCLHPFGKTKEATSGKSSPPSPVGLRGYETIVR
jgi:hypothetical protein